MRTKTDVYSRRGVADIVISDLAVVPSIQVAERKTPETLLRALNLQRSEHVTYPTTQKIGKEVGAECAVIGSFTSLVPSIRLDVSIIKIRSAQQRWLTDLRQDGLYWLRIPPGERQAARFITRAPLIKQWFLGGAMACRTPMIRPSADTFCAFADRGLQQQMCHNTPDCVPESSAWNRTQ